MRERVCVCASEREREVKEREGVSDCVCVWGGGETKLIK